MKDFWILLLVSFAIGLAVTLWINDLIRTNGLNSLGPGPVQPERPRVLSPRGEGAPRRRIGAAIVGRVLKRLNREGRAMHGG